MKVRCSPSFAPQSIYGQAGGGLSLPRQRPVLSLRRASESRLKVWRWSIGRFAPGECWGVWSRAAFAIRSWAGFGASPTLHEEDSEITHHRLLRRFTLITGSTFGWIVARDRLGSPPLRSREYKVFSLRRRPLQNVVYRRRFADHTMDFHLSLVRPHSVENCHVPVFPVGWMDCCGKWVLWLLPRVSLRRQKGIPHAAQTTPTCLPCGVG